MDEQKKKKKNQTQYVPWLVCDKKYNINYQKIERKKKEKNLILLPNVTLPDSIIIQIFYKLLPFHPVD